MIRTLIVSSVLALCLVSVQEAHASKEVGNGGDEIRSEFLSRGREVLTYLLRDSDGKRMVHAYHLDVQALEDTLTIERIRVVPGPLTDNGGSLVDARVVPATREEPSAVELDETRWATILDPEFGNYDLVFHEMLRLIDCNDDNYVISAKLRSFRDPLWGADTKAALVRVQDLCDFERVGCNAPAKAISISLTQPTQTTLAQTLLQFAEIRIISRQDEIQERGFSVSGKPWVGRVLEIREADSKARLSGYWMEFLQTAVRQKDRGVVRERLFVSADLMSFALDHPPEFLSRDF